MPTLPRPPASPNYTYADLYAASVVPLYRRRNAHPTAYEGLVRSRPARPTPVAEWPIVWRTGPVRLRTLALLSAQAEALRLRIELLTADERRHREGLERAESAAQVRPVKNRVGEVIGWMPRNFTMSGKQHTDGARELMRERALAAWAEGRRARPTWLPGVRALPEGAVPIKRERKDPAVRADIAPPIPEDERPVKREQEALADPLASPAPAKGKRARSARG